MICPSARRPHLLKRFEREGREKFAAAGAAFLTPEGQKEDAARLQRAEAIAPRPRSRPPCLNGPDPP